MSRRWQDPLAPLETPRQGHVGDAAQRLAYPPGVPRLASRREVLARAAKLGLAAAGFGAAWAAMRDPLGEGALERPEVVRLPEGGFAVAEKAGLPKLVVVHGTDALAMLRAGLDALGGIGRFVSAGDRVIVKPNVAFDRSPALGATTSPDVLAAAVRLFRAEGASEVRVLDNPINSPEGCFHRSGIARAAGEAGARLILPDPVHFRTLEVPGAELIARWPMFYRPFADATRVVGISPLKDHNLCSASMTMKNWYGLLGGRRNQFHQRIHDIVSELAMMIRPTLVVLDATRVMMRNGPTGGSLSDVKRMDTLVLATDQCAADAYGYETLLGRDPQKLPYLELAEKRGAGNRNWRSVPMRELTV
ncbi:MAG: DUF362 domain-containing protein [Candidatus Wallbacteria bacterium]|nr:DUF362 domain-containing protein [Candidatus Wallbacteria bacterium]